MLVELVAWLGMITESCSDPMLKSSPKRMDMDKSTSSCHSDPGLWSAEELVMMMGSAGMKLKEVQGMYLNPFSRKWSLTDDLAVNYIAAFTWL